MKASIIIPLWNGEKYIKDCLKSVLNQDYPDLEIIVVDNASTDDGADLVAQRFPTVQLIRNSSNLGFAGGCNVGLRAATGEVLVLLNQDTKVYPNWLIALVKMIRQANVGVAGSKIYYPDGQILQHTGGTIDWMTGSTNHFGHHQKDSEDWQVASQVEYVTGAAMAIHQTVIAKIGLFDEAFWPGYFEDTDFCFRATQAGFEIWYTPDAQLIHVETGSQTDSTLIWQNHHRGRLHFLLKHRSPDYLLTQFHSAELAYQKQILQAQGSASICRAYLETIARVGVVLQQYWFADYETIRAVSQMFADLYSTAWEMNQDIPLAHLEEQLPTPMPTFPETAPLGGCNIANKPLTPTSPLQEFEFCSNIPLIGPLIGQVRSFWYNIAARWAIRDLINQQTQINHQLSHQLNLNRDQQQQVNHQLSHQLNLTRDQQQQVNHQLNLTRDQQQQVNHRMKHYLDELAYQNTLLAQEIARLTRPPDVN